MSLLCYWDFRYRPTIIEAHDTWLIVALALLAAAMMAVVIWGYWGWTLMLVLLMLMGPAHRPTANDDVSLGTGRRILGWASLLFVPLGFTPVPFSFPM